MLKSIKSALALLFTVVVIVLAIIFALRSYYPQTRLAVSEDTPLVIAVERGDTSRDVLMRLQQQQLISSARLHYWLAKLSGQLGPIKQGYYEFTAATDWQTFWGKLINGEQMLFQVTVIEGQTAAQALATLQQAPHLTHDTAGLSMTAIAERLSDGAFHNLEGLLLPETYAYQAGSSDWDILQHAYESMHQHLMEAWQQCAAPCAVDTPYQLLILASIIEKETGLNSERELVASVFANRLRKGMRLQSDPTTIYGIKDFDGNLTRAHLRERTPYNTYRIDGLPPTPIALPGIASLQAAAKPADTDYLYFVANADGQHVFSKTLAEHQKAVNKYQKGQ